MTLTYKDSGVDIEKGDALVESIKSKVKRTYGDRVESGVGGFACLYRAGDRLLAAGTDGVGTKLKLAFECNKHDSVGIDLVAMCINDILCTGAKPLFFMDYLATGKLDLEVSEAILDGIVEGCLQSECALIGGETAEMPGMYSAGEYDLAGFGVGEVFPDQILGGEKIKPGATILGLASDGFHSNGYSLLRRIIENESIDVKKRFLRPTKIYWKDVKPLLEKSLITGMSHITGGGLFNIPRINENVDYHIHTKAQDWREAYFDEDYKWVQDKASLSIEEMLKTFNCGIGLVLITDHPEQVKELLAHTVVYDLGIVKEGAGKVLLGGVEYNS